MKIYNHILIMISVSAVYGIYPLNELKTKNWTPFFIKAKCSRVGVADGDWITIAPGERKSVGCGAAIQNGIKVQILGARDGWKDCEIKSDWSGRSQSENVDVALIPHYKIGEKGKALFSVDEYKIAIMRDAEEYEAEVPFVCKGK